MGQGDIFGRLPVLEVEMQEDGQVVAGLNAGPAILLTHDCAMDKPDRAGLPRVERFQFAAVRSMESLPPDRRRNLTGQAHQVPPYEVLYLGKVADYGECFMLLSDPYYLPAKFFEPHFADYVGHVAVPDPSGPTSFITPGRNDSRLGRIDEYQLDLLRLKMLAYWTRLEPAV